MVLTGHIIDHYAIGQAVLALANHEHRQHATINFHVGFKFQGNSINIIVLNRLLYLSHRDFLALVFFIGIEGTVQTNTKPDIKPAVYCVLLYQLEFHHNQSFRPFLIAPVISLNTPLFFGAS